MLRAVDPVQITLPMAVAITNVYPTCISLYQAYLRCGDEKERENLIAKSVQWSDDVEYEIHADDPELYKVAQFCKQLSPQSGNEYRCSREISIMIYESFWKET